MVANAVGARVIEPISQHAILGHHPSAEVPDHDEAGFRNAMRPETVDVVAIGDSQTYGSSVDREHAWPQRLEGLSGLRVHNLAYGGYGPSHYLVLADEALKLNPRLILVGFYAGNDLVDSYKMVYGRNCLPWLRADDENVLAELKQADERGDGLVAGWRELIAATRRPRRERSWIRSLVIDHLKILGMARAVARSIRGYDGGAITQRQLDKEWEYRSAIVSKVNNRNILLSYEKGGVRTVLTPRARYCPLNLKDPRVRKGERICLEAIRRIREVARGRAKVAVVLIPTKELVFHDVVGAECEQLPGTLHELIAHERQVQTRTKEFLNTSQIPWIDAQIPLQESLMNGENPYHENWDSHANNTGNLVIAEAIATSQVIRSLK